MDCEGRIATLVGSIGRENVPQSGHDEFLCWKLGGDFVSNRKCAVHFSILAGFEFWPWQHNTLEISRVRRIERVYPSQISETGSGKSNWDEEAQRKILRLSDAGSR